MAGEGETLQKASSCRFAVNHTLRVGADVLSRSSRCRYSCHQVPARLPTSVGVINKAMIVLELCWERVHMNWILVLDITHPASLQASGKQNENKHVNGILTRGQ